jgi:Predicted rRNA methylase
VRDSGLRKSAVMEVADCAYDMGLGCEGVVASSLPGPSGNVEYFLWLKRGSTELSETTLDAAIASGPQ